MAWGTNFRFDGRDDVVRPAPPGWSNACDPQRIDAFALVTARGVGRFHANPGSTGSRVVSHASRKVHTFEGASSAFVGVPPPVVPRTADHRGDNRSAGRVPMRTSPSCTQATSASHLPPRFVHLATTPAVHRPPRTRACAARASSSGPCARPTCPGSDRCANSCSKGDTYRSRCRTPV